MGGGKTLREHLEVVNHISALALFEDLATQRRPLTAFVVRRIHALILRGIDDAHAGPWRTGEMRIAGSRHIPPRAVEVPALMEDLFRWYDGPARALHPVRRAARLHQRFTHIHPFVDGNGRTARILTNLVLAEADHPPVVISVEHRAAYLDALEAASTGGPVEPFETLVAEAVLEALDLDGWLALIPQPPPPIGGPGR